MRASAVSKQQSAKTRSITGDRTNIVNESEILVHIFQYLDIQDLQHVSRVCTLWRQSAHHTLLWRTVRIKNIVIHDFQAFLDTLVKHGTVHLDICFKSNSSTENYDMWLTYCTRLREIRTLKRLDLYLCSADMVELLAFATYNLEVINAEVIVSPYSKYMSLNMLRSHKNVKELRLKATRGFVLTSDSVKNLNELQLKAIRGFVVTSDLTPLEVKNLKLQMKAARGFVLASDLSPLLELKELTHLSLTGIKGLYNFNIEVIADLKSLMSLDLGDCTDFPPTFGRNILAGLCKLRKLRLEKCPGNCFSLMILDAVKSMPELEQLELVNIEIRCGFDTALGACSNIKQLLIIPMYVTQSANTMNTVLRGVLKLRKTLLRLVWCVTWELMKACDMLVTQFICNEVEGLAPIESCNNVPFLRPILLLKSISEIDDPSHELPVVGIIPVQNFRQLLSQKIPNATVEILKIPYHSTWQTDLESCPEFRP